MTPGSAFDPTAWLDLLDRHNVDFIVVGGYAATLHGARRPTTDIDVVPRWEAENLNRLCSALREVAAESTTGLPISGQDITSDVLVEREVMTWHTTIGRIDTLVGIPDSNGMPVIFEDLRARASRVAIDDQVVVVASLSDVITSKEYAGRRKDSEALPELRELHDQSSRGRQRP